MILDGKSLAKSIRADLQKKVRKLKNDLDKTPLLVTIQVGNDPASTTYVNMKAKACADIGMHSKQIIFPDASAMTTQDVIKKIRELNSFINMCWYWVL